jgi:hypothetical protein
MKCPGPDRRESLPALVWRRVRPELSADEAVAWCGQPVPWRMALRQAVAPGCGLVLGLTAVCVLAAVDGVLRWCGIQNWFIGITFWVACAASGCALLYLAFVPPLAWWCARRTG